MPRIVDHIERREELAEAVLGVIAEHGLEATTVRRVAAASGWSTGSLVHYFSDKETLLRFALGQLFERVRSRAEEAALSDDEPYERVRRSLIAMLPLDRNGRMENRIWCALLGAAITRPTIADLHVQSSRLLADQIARGLREAQNAGRIAAGIDADHEAASLIAMTEGLALRASFDPEMLPPKLLTQFVDERLAQISNFSRDR